MVNYDYVNECTQIPLSSILCLVYLIEPLSQVRVRLSVLFNSQEKNILFFVCSQIMKISITIIVKSKEYTCIQSKRKRNPCIKLYLALNHMFGFLGTLCAKAPVMH